MPYFLIRNSWEAEKLVRGAANHGPSYAIEKKMFFLTSRDRNGLADQKVRRVQLTFAVAHVGLFDPTSYFGSGRIWLCSGTFDAGFFCPTCAR